MDVPEWVIVAEFFAGVRHQAAWQELVQELFTDYMYHMSGLDSGNIFARFLQTP